MRDGNRQGRAVRAHSAWRGCAPPSKKCALHWLVMVWRNHQHTLTSHRTEHTCGCATHTSTHTFDFRLRFAPPATRLTRYLESTVPEKRRARTPVCSVRTEARGRERALARAPPESPIAQGVAELPHSHPHEPGCRESTLPVPDPRGSLRIQMRIALSSGHEG